MTTAAALATIADLEQQPGRCELIDGEMIEMAPSGFQHAQTVARIARLLEEYVEKTPSLGVVLAGDPGFILDDQNVRAPDVAFLTIERAAQAPAKGFMPFVPTLAIEVVSPGDAHMEVTAKARMWVRRGVSLVWVADPRNRTVEIYRRGRDVVMLDEEAAITGDDVLPGFSCRVDRLFPM
jgi:Uma2 family endonuclease